MTRNEIDSIATDAECLLDELKNREFSFPDCMALLTAAMPAIVTANTAAWRD